MLKAYCKRLRGRCLLLNNTSFSFDEDGYCEVEDVGNAKLDFELLLKKNGVSRVCDEDCEQEHGEERPLDERSGIDAELLEEEEPEEEDLEDEEEEEDSEDLDEESEEDEDEEDLEDED